MSDAPDAPVPDAVLPDYPLPDTVFDKTVLPDVVSPNTVLRGRVVTPRGLIDDGLVAVAGDRIAWVGPVERAPERLEVPGRSGATLLPGLIDLHCHGGGGASFPDASDTATARRAVAEHLAHGTTGVVATLVTADAATLLERTAVLADLADAGEIVGIHLEGPFLSRTRCGAQDPALLIPGDTGLVDALLQAGRGHVTTMTLAPEIPGVGGPGGVIEQLARRGVVPSIGHTDAPAELVESALGFARETLVRAADDGSSGRASTRPTATHLFNAMRPLHHRDPGPIAACLAAAGRGEAVVELVADGVHLAEATVRAVFDLVGPEAIALVTDAMAAAGMADGRYELGPVEVRVVDGVARLVEGDAIAGGTSHLLDVVRWTVGCGVPLVDAVRAAATTPAEVLGRADIGALEPGRRADILLTDRSLQPRQVIRAGTSHPR